MKKKSRAYIYFILLWTFILLAAGVYGLYKLNDFLTVYEQCELAPVKAHFEESYSESNIPDGVIESYIASLDGNIHSAGEYREIILSQLRGDMQLEKLTGESGLSKAVYSIKVNGTAVGTAVFEKTVPMPYGLLAWRCSAESYSFDYLLETAEIEVPSDYTVYAGGSILDSGYVVSKRPVEGYENVLRYTGGISRELYTYSVNAMNPGSFTVYDEYGREVQPHELGTERFMQNCPANDRAAVEKLSEDFIRLYTNYSTGYQYLYYYEQLKLLCVQYSDIMTRLTQSLEGYGYSMRRTAEISAFDIYRVSAVNESEFICDVRYTVDANAYTEIISTDYDVRLLIEKTDGRYLVSVLTSN